MFRKLLVLFVVLGLCVSQDKDYNMTFNDTVQLVQGLFKSLKISDDQQSIDNCAQAGVSFRDLVEHDFTGVISSSELGPQINQTLLTNLTRDFFNHTTQTVLQCGNLGMGIYKFVVKLIKFIISGDAWMGALRRLKDDGFTILGSLGVGFRMLDSHRFYEAGIEFGMMAQTLLFGNDQIRMKRMLSMNRQINIHDIMRARRYMVHFQKLAKVMAQTDKSVWKQILDGLIKAFDDNKAVDDGKKCVKSVVDTGVQLRNIKWNEQQSVENVTATINATGNNFVNVVDLCTQGVNKVIRVGGVSIDFFKKLTGKNILGVLYDQMQMIVDSDIDAFKMIYERRDVENATTTLANQLMTVLHLIRENELKL